MTDPQSAADARIPQRTTVQRVGASLWERLSDAIVDNPIFLRELRRRMRGRALFVAMIAYIAIMCGVAFVIVQTAPLKLRFSIPERYLSELRTGQTIIARVDPYPDEKFAGRIKTLGGVIDPATRTFFAEAEFPNSDGRLRPGLFARIELGAEDSHAKAR